MHIEIRFDKSSSSWGKDFEFNKMFAKAQLMYIMDCYKVKGYMYLNAIYETFGIKWNPYNDNACWVLERDGELELSIIYDDKTRNKITIDILCNS